MHAHLIFAHPNLDSFNGQLRDVAIQTLQQAGWTVTVSDLYQIKFKAAADQDDYTELSYPDFFDVQNEQRAALANQTFSEDIQHEHALLSQADLIIFQFPLWWYSMPALMKGYIDRVFSMGWAYGGGKALVGKRVLVSTTTGAPEENWVPEKRGTIREIFKHLFVGTFALCGMKPLEPFIVHGIRRLSADHRQDALNRLTTHLIQLTTQMLP